MADNIVGVVNNTQTARRGSDGREHRNKNKQPAHFKININVRNM